MKLMKSYNISFCYSVNNIMSLASYHGVKAMYVGNVFSCPVYALVSVFTQKMVRLHLA